MSNSFSKIKFTQEGGLAIWVENQTGTTSIKGLIVEASTSDFSVTTAAAGAIDPLGVIYTSGIANGSNMWVVTNGMADVALATNTSGTAGNWVGTDSTEAGYGDATAASPSTASVHFQECGHCIETVAASTSDVHVLARCALHFN